MCGAQGLYSAVKGKVPVPSSKLSSCLDWEPPFFLCSLTRTWKTNNILLAAKDDNWGETRLTKVFVLLGTEESLTTSISFLTLLYSAVHPCSRGKARVVEKRIGRVFQLVGCDLYNKLHPSLLCHHGAPIRGCSFWTGLKGPVSFRASQKRLRWTQGQG